jgi:hypothetical protein
MKPCSMLSVARSTSKAGTAASRSARRPAAGTCFGTCIQSKGSCWSISVFLCATAASTFKHFSTRLLTLLLLPAVMSLPMLLLGGPVLCCAVMCWGNISNFNVAAAERKLTDMLTWRQLHG